MKILKRERNRGSKSPIKKIYGRRRVKNQGALAQKSSSDLSFPGMIEKVQLLVVMLDLHGNVLSHNEYLLKHFGWKRKGILGKNWFDIFVPASSRERLRLLYFQNILLETFPIQLNYEVQNPQGGQHLISWTNALLRDGQGGIAGMFCIGTEVTLEAISQGEKEKPEPSVKRGSFDVALPNSHEEAQSSTCLAADSQGAFTNMTKGPNLEMGVKGLEKGPTNRGGKYLSFFLDQEEFGIGIEKVKEIMGVVPIRPLPKTPAYIKGIINLRGQMIPIVDLRLKFGMEKVDYTPKTCIVILEIGRATGSLRIGIIVDTVLEVLNIKEDEIEDTPSFGVGIETECILGLAKSNGKIRILLNVEQVLRSEIFLAPARAKAFMNLSDSTKNQN